MNGKPVAIALAAVPGPGTAAFAGNAPDIMSTGAVQSIDRARFEPVLDSGAVLGPPKDFHDGSIVAGDAVKIVWEHVDGDRDVNEISVPN